VAYLRHRRQRTLHPLRHGWRHLLRHVRGEEHPHKRRKLSGAQRSNRRSFRVGVAMLVLGSAFFLVVLVLAAIHLNNARSSLEQARSDLTMLLDHRSDLLTTQGRAKAIQQLDRAAAEATRAEHVIHDSPSISVLAKVPVIGQQVSGVRDLAGDVISGSLQGASLIRQIDALNDANSGATISLPKLENLRASVSRASDALILLERPSGGLFGPVGSARSQFNEKINKIVVELNRAQQILTYATTFLGGDGPRTYLLAAENQAEMRDQGSVLSVGQVRASGGHLSTDSPASVANYPLSEPVDYPMPRGTRAVFGADGPTQIWQNANLTADFPWTGGDLLAMYEKATGIKDDGVIALDVHALAGLLSLSGPVTVPGIDTQISSSNVSALLLDTLYREHPAGNQSGRKDEIAAVAEASVQKLSSEHIDVAELGHVLASEVAGRHLLLFDATPSNEATLKRYGASGAVDTTLPTKTFHLAIENATATKLDYFLSTSVQQQVILTPRGDADVLTSVTVTNHAPANQLPSYQLGPDGFSSHVTGEYVGIAYLWAPRGSIQAAGVSESGLEVSSANLDLLPGKSETLKFALVIPHAVSNGTLTLRWVPQPTVQPQKITVSVSTLNGSAIKKAKRRVVLESPQSLSWSMSS